VNYANIAVLPNGNLLVGWAEMSSKTGVAGSSSIPLANGYRVAEVDSNGVMLTEPVATSNGWGSVDNWDTINGNPVWVFAQGPSAEYSYTSYTANLQIMTYIPTTPPPMATDSKGVGETSEPTNTSSTVKIQISPTSNEGLAGYQVALVVLVSIAFLLVVLTVVFVVIHNTKPERV